MQIWLSDFSQWLLNPSLATYFIHKLKSKLFSVAQMALYMWAQAVFMYIYIQKYLFFLCLRFFSAYLPL